MINLFKLKRHKYKKGIIQNSKRFKVSWRCNHIELLIFIIIISLCLSIILTSKYYHSYNNNLTSIDNQTYLQTILGEDPEAKGIKIKKPLSDCYFPISIKSMEVGSQLPTKDMTENSVHQDLNTTNSVTLRPEYQDPGNNSYRNTDPSQSTVNSFSLVCPIVEKCNLTHDLAGISDKVISMKLDHSLEMIAMLHHRLEEWEKVWNEKTKGLEKDVSKLTKTVGSTCNILKSHSTKLNRIYRKIDESVVDLDQEIELHEVIDKSKKSTKSSSRKSVKHVARTVKNGENYKHLKDSSIAVTNQISIPSTSSSVVDNSINPSIKSSNAKNRQKKWKERKQNLRSTGNKNTRLNDRLLEVSIMESSKKHNNRPKNPECTVYPKSSFADFDELIH